MKLIISTEADRLTVGTILIKNGYTVASVRKIGKEDAHIEYRKEGKE